MAGLLDEAFNQVPDARRAMIPMASESGALALRKAMDEHALIAFDYDGTLAPITGRYQDTCTPPAVIASLQKLVQLATVVVITGRSVADVSPRLGFSPYAIVGNHGAEGLFTAETARHTEQVAHWRAAIEARFGPGFRNLGVVLEDKACSLSLHYRQASDAIAAQEIIAQACALIGPAARIFGGKCVVNIVPSDAPDKADSLLAMTRYGQAPAIFVGDDENDEVVFRRAPVHWLTVRVGRHHESMARYYLEDQEQMLQFIDSMLGLLLR